MKRLDTHKSVANLNWHTVGKTIDRYSKWLDTDTFTDISVALFEEVCLKRIDETII